MQKNGMRFGRWCVQTYKPKLRVFRDPALFAVPLLRFIICVDLVKSFLRHTKYVVGL